MAFKLGSERRPNKLSLGSKSGGIGAKDDASVPGTPVIRKDLEKGISGEANIDGSIFLNIQILILVSLTQSNFIIFRHL